MSLQQKKAVLDCCGCGCKTGCCIPVDHSNPLYEPRGTPKNIPFCIEAPGCPQIDGFCGEMICGGAAPAVIGPCGVCTTCSGGAEFLLPAFKWLVSLPDGSCMPDTCSIRLCLQIVCIDSIQGAGGIEQCCSKFRLIVGTSEVQTEDNGTCPRPPNCARSSKCVPPDICVCSENPDEFPVAEFPLSLSFFCDNFHTTGGCAGRPTCCMFLVNCDLTGAKVVI